VRPAETQRAGISGATAERAERGFEERHPPWAGRGAGRRPPRQRGAEPVRERELREWEPPGRRASGGHPAPQRAWPAARLPRPKRPVHIRSPQRRRRPRPAAFRLGRVPHPGCSRSGGPAPPRSSSSNVRAPCRRPALRSTTQRVRRGRARARRHWSRRGRTPERADAAGLAGGGAA
jgi:hypothetical protein